MPKNNYELDRIPTEKLFISESDYAYNIDEIISYLKCTGAYSDAWAGTFKPEGLLLDFKNRLHSPAGRDFFRTRLFTENDVEQLLKFVSFRQVSHDLRGNEDENDLPSKTQSLHAACSLIQLDTLALIKTVADAAKVLENQLLSQNEDTVGDELGLPIQKLYEHLTKPLNSFPPEEQEKRKYERNMLLLLTTSKENRLTEYGTLRSMGGVEGLVGDLFVITKKHACSSGFGKSIAGLYGLIQSHQRLDAVEHRLEAKQTESVKIPPVTSSNQSFFSTATSEKTIDNIMAQEDIALALEFLNEQLSLTERHNIGIKELEHIPSVYNANKIERENDRNQFKILLESAYQDDPHHPPLTVIISKQQLTELADKQRLLDENRKRL